MFNIPCACNNHENPIVSDIRNSVYKKYIEDQLKADDLMDSLSVPELQEVIDTMSTNKALSGDNFETKDILTSIIDRGRKIIYNKQNKTDISNIHDYINSIINDVRVYPCL